MFEDIEGFGFGVIFVGCVVVENVVEEIQIVVYVVYFNCFSVWGVIVVVSLQVVLLFFWV